MIIIGIDPGDNGGIAVIPLYAFHQTKAYPLADYSIPQIASLFREFREGSEDISDQEHWKDTNVEVYLEEPSLNPYLPGKACPVCKKRPMRNSQSYWVLGRSLGVLEGIVLANNYTITGLSPQKWQKRLGCLTGGDKNVSKKFAESAFPFLTRTTKAGKVSSSVTHAIADALLIALYGYLEYATKIPSSVLYTFGREVIENGTVRPNVRNGTRPGSVAGSSSVPSRSRPSKPARLVATRANGR